MTRQGVVIIVAKSFAGTGRIEANGASATSLGNFFLAGGGGGGVIITVSRSTLGRIVTSVDAGSGAGGLGEAGSVFHVTD